MGNILMRRALMTGEADLFPQYVQNGLVFCLDGIKNTPNGHNPNSQYWVDLANPTEGYLYDSSSVITNKYCIPNGRFYRKNISTGETVNIPLVSADYQTVEFVMEVIPGETTRQWLIGRNANGQGNSLIDVSTYGCIVFGTRSSGANAKMTPYLNGIHTYSQRGTGDNNVYVDGAAIEATQNPLGMASSSRNSIFYYRTTEPDVNISKIYAMRIYSRGLTADELAQNAEVDRKRFGNPLIPIGYQQIEYIERPSGTATNTAFNTTGVRVDNTSNWEFRIGFMPLAQPTSSSGGYLVGCRMNDTSNSVGFGIYMPQASTQFGTWDGVSCLISPNGGSSVLNTKYDIVATKTPTGCTITDGTNSNSASNESPRTIANDLDLYGVRKYNSSSNLNTPSFGRIYYLNIKKNGADVCNLIPCKRQSDNAVGMWDTVQEVFRTASYTAGQYV